MRDRKKLILKNYFGYPGLFESRRLRKMLSSITLNIFLFLILFNQFACKHSNSSTEEASYSGLLANLFSSFNPKPSLKSISESFISYNYSDLESKTISFKTLASALPDSCNSQTGNLIGLQTSWKESYSILKKLEVVQFGASSTYTGIDSWPLNYLNNPPDTVKIEASISGTETLNETTLSSKTDNENGFPAIEYLLFDNGSGSKDAASICAGLTGRRKTYLQESINLLYTRISRINSNWNPVNSGNFSTILQTAGPLNEYYKSDKEVLDTLIKQIVNMVEKIKDVKVGYPSGLATQSGGVVRTSYIESRYSDRSIENIRYNLEGLFSFYLGAGGPGISDYVRYYNLPLDLRIREKVAQVQNKANEISNLKEEINSGSTKVKEFYTLLNELKILFSVELAANLGSTFTPGLGDGDGD